MQIHLLRSIQNLFVCLVLPIPVNVVFAVVGVVIVDHELHIVHIQASEIIKLSKVLGFHKFDKRKTRKYVMNKKPCSNIGGHKNCRFPGLELCQHPLPGKHQHF